VEAKEIEFEPGQQTGLHFHPCPVVGYIAKGTVLFEVEGEAPQTLHACDAFHEPANRKILHFDNASATDR
jgi:quercetin dioxygenase-like cupin family protein